MAKKEILILDLEPDFSLIGIQTALEAYELAWELNQNSFLKFKRDKDHSIFQSKHNRKIAFIQYIFADDLQKITYKLLENRNNGEVLIRELKNIDYLLLLQSEESADSIAQELRQWVNGQKIGDIFMLPVNPNQLKELGNLLT